MTPYLSCETFRYMKVDTNSRTVLPDTSLTLYNVKARRGGSYILICPASTPDNNRVSELDEQQEVVYSLRKDGEVVFATMNEGERDKAANARAKRAGMYTGASDLVWPRADGTTAYIEMKRASGKPADIKPEQDTFLGQMGKRGHLAVVCFGYKAGRYLTTHADEFLLYVRDLNKC